MLTLFLWAIPVVAPLWGNYGTSWVEDPSCPCLQPCAAKLCATSPPYALKSQRLTAFCFVCLFASFLHCCPGKAKGNKEQVEAEGQWEEMVEELDVCILSVWTAAGGGAG